MPKIEETGYVSFKQAFIDLFKGYFNFSGRTTRSGYWWGQLVLYVYAFIVIVGSVMLMDKNFTAGIITLIVLSLLALIPSISLAVRRYRDAGWTGKGIWTYYIVNVLFSILTALWPTIGPFKVLDSLLTTISFIALIVVSDSMTTKQTAPFIRFFLREKTTAVRELNETGRVSFKQAIVDVFRGYATFGGETTRAGFWWPTLVVALVVALGFGCVAYGGAEMALTLSATPIVVFTIGIIILLLISCIAIIPTMTLVIRRLRDVGFSNTGIAILYTVFIVLSMISSVAGSGVFATVMLVITAIVEIGMIVLFCLPSQKLASAKQTTFARLMFRQI